MPRYVALLRGINVGGATTLPMASLKAVFEQSGARDVRTYIQSGNVVFDHAARSEARLVSNLERLLTDRTQRTIDVMVRTAAQIQAVIERNPYPDASGTTLHVSFLRSSPDTDALENLDLGRFAPERITVVDREIYLYLPFGMGRSKLAIELNKLKTPATARNWNTVTKVAEMAAS